MSIRLVMFLAMAFTVCACPSDGADLADQLKEAQDEHTRRVSRAQAEFKEQVQRYARLSISRFESLAASAIRAGDIATATMVWKQVLVLDRTHKKAVAHFKAIGQLDAVMKEIGDKSGVVDSPTADVDSAAELRRRLVNTRWQWKPEDSQLIMFHPKGVVQGTWSQVPGTWFVNPDLTVTWYFPNLGYVNILKFDEDLTEVQDKATSVL